MVDEFLTTKMMSETKDCRGLPVSVGTKVRVLTIRPSVAERLSPHSMLGDVLEVYEVDEWGSAWVTKWWHEKDGKAFSHSIALAPEEMEAA